MILPVGGTVGAGLSGAVGWFSKDINAKLPQVLPYQDWGIALVGGNMFGVAAKALREFVLERGGNSGGGML